MYVEYYAGGRYVFEFLSIYCPHLFCLARSMGSYALGAVWRLQSLFNMRTDNSNLAGYPIRSEWHFFLGMNDTVRIIYNHIRWDAPRGKWRFNGIPEPKNVMSSWWWRLHPGRGPLHPQLPKSRCLHKVGARVPVINREFYNFITPISMGSVTPVKPHLF